MMEFEYCTDPSCPGLEGNSEDMSVHPKNEVGNCCKLNYFKHKHDNFPCLDCGIPNTDNDNRIVGGVKTDVGEYPWQVLHILTHVVVVCIVYVYCIVDVLSGG